jgi:hypothetical protein
MDNILRELELRVDFLEEEVGRSYDESIFKGKVRAVFPDDAHIEFRSGDYGLFALVTRINGDDIDRAITKFDRSKYGYAVTHTASGVGMEVWVEPEF